MKNWLHGEDAGSVVPELWMELVPELVAWAARSGPLRAAALDHEVVDDPVECEAVEEGLVLSPRGLDGPLGQADEVCHGQGRLLKLQPGGDDSLAGVELGKQSFFAHGDSPCWVSDTLTRDVRLTTSPAQGCPRS